MAIARLLLVMVAAVGCGDRGTPERRAPADAAPAPRSDAAPPAGPDAFAPLRRLGAEWRYEVQARRKDKLEPLAGVTVVLRVADVAVKPDHALVTLAGRIEPPSAHAPAELAIQLAQPMRFMLLADGLVELLPPVHGESSVEHAAASLADREVRDGDIMLPARYRDGWAIQFAAKDAHGEAPLLRSRRSLGGRDVEIWTLAWQSEIAAPPLRKRPWKWQKIRYQVAYSPEVGFVTLDSLGADFVLTLRD
jgi:hypothetical protein